MGCGCLGPRSALPNHEKVKSPVDNAKVDFEAAVDHGLSEGEWNKVLSSLGRTPTWSELGVISVMWSEHCSYKSSRVHLRKFPTEAPWVLQGPGENAGVIDIGDGLAACFKMESHNHPSFIEPYQGAATGVGGIMRDIFTMGARPVANLNSLRFGRPEAPRMRFLLEGVVAGIANYGNCMGVPTVGGEVAFDEQYDGNILVNAFTLGVMPSSRIFRSGATGSGNPVMYVGSKTGRDGIHGATMASEEFGDNDDAKRPRVQVGDPFTEKKLLEACLELMKEDAVLAIQDMGAAGLTSSTCEMAAKGGSGIEIDVTKVPQRELGMTPYEILLSESQERMLMVVKPGAEARVTEIFTKWDLDAAVIGLVTNSGQVVVREGDQEVVRLPTELLVDDAPKYDRPTRRPNLEQVWHQLPQLSDLRAEGTTSAEARLLRLLARPTIASKRWVFEQYDWSVRTSTVRGPGEADAAVIRLPNVQSEPNPHTCRGLAMTVDMNARFVHLDPRRGAYLGVLEAARNLVCVGARPMALTDCLNFGNPEKPEVMWSLVEAIEGMSQACRDLDTPVVSGNVSLYNETNGRAILPTPTVGMVGLVDDVTKSPGMAFQREGDEVLLLGEPADAVLGGSELVLMEAGGLLGQPAEPNIDRARRLHTTVLEAIRSGYISSAHDAAEGGLLVAIAESVVNGRIGAKLGLPFEVSLASLFGEGASIILVSTSHGESVRTLAETHGCPVYNLGVVGGQALVVDQLCEVRVEILANVWEDGLRQAFDLSRT
ncbi:MAG: phosphoribosylformylglycinamidine synthase subunit PurL [Myxococcales bacterium]|nr:phosphoribosylformylglycinamidine synthase subunit PurL [Myxococcales bacterium]